MSEAVIKVVINLRLTLAVSAAAFITSDVLFLTLAVTTERVILMLVHIDHVVIIHPACDNGTSGGPDMLKMGLDM